MVVNVIANVLSNTFFLVHKPFNITIIYSSVFNFELNIRFCLVNHYIICDKIILIQIINTKNSKKIHLRRKVYFNARH